MPYMYVTKHYLYLSTTAITYHGAFARSLAIVCHAPEAACHIG